MVKYWVPMMASSGYVGQVNEALCAACSACVGARPFGAIQMNGTAVVKLQDCMGYEIYLGQCPNETMSLVRDERERCATGRAAISLRTRCALHSSLILYFIPKSLPLPPYKEWTVGEIVKLALWPAGFRENGEYFLKSTRGHFGKACSIAIGNR